MNPFRIVAGWLRAPAYREAIVYSAMAAVVLMAVTLVANHA